MSVNRSAKSGDIIGISISIFFNMKLYCVFSLESRDSDEYTPYTISQYEKENHPKLSQICSCGIFPRDPVRNSHGKRAISIRAIEVLLYFFPICYFFILGLAITSQTIHQQQQHTKQHTWPYSTGKNREMLGNVIGSCNSRSHGPIKFEDFS